VTVSRSVVPGEWYAVLGDEVVVLLPPAAKARVAGVWELVDDGAGFDVVLDGLISGGLRELPAFVLLSEIGGDVRLVIRGAGTADLDAADGLVTISGDADSTWVERTVTGVTALRLQVAEGADAGGDGSAYTLGSGLVRASVVEQPPPVAAGETGPLVGAHVDPAPPPIPEPPSSVEPPLSSVEPPPSSVERSRDPEPAFEPDILGAEPIAPPVSPAVPDRDHAAIARLVMSTGEVVDVDRPILVGRAPQPRGFGGEEPLLVSVLSPNQEISSTHVEIRPGSGPDAGSAVVTDLGSTNGTLVVQPGSRPEDLQPGIAVRLAPGAVIDLGEGATIQVTPV
jgi:hypothetical protein